MKTASNVVERVEEYRYYSGYIGDVRELSLKVLAVRLNRFHKVRKRDIKAKSVKGGPTGKNNKGRR